MIYLLTFIAIALSVAIVLLPPPRKITVSVGGVEVKAIEPRSLVGKAAGLMGRKNRVGENAMLFRFFIPGKKTFWTAGMNFPIDIFWIKEGEIISVSENVGPGMDIIVSPKGTDSVLEISSSLSRKKALPKYGKIIYR
jgi:uncharacterized membrane protein (UPF0127 family)